MRINEIASAEEQIALFKLITDKVWQALADQQRADAEANRAKETSRKMTGRSRALPAVPSRPAAAKPVSFKTTSLKPSVGKVPVPTGKILATSGMAKPAATARPAGNPSQHSATRLEMPSNDPLDTISGKNSRV